MGEYWRFLYTDGTVSLADLEAGFRSIDARFRLHIDSAAGNIADLLYGDDVYAEIELNSPQGDLFQDDLDALREQLADADADDEAAIAQITTVFDRARGMVALRPTDFGIVYFSRIEPIWDWLFAHMPGLLQIDDDGYYTREGTLLALDVEPDDAEDGE